MEISIISDTVATVATIPGLGFAKSVSHNYLSFLNSSSEQPSSSAGPLQISAAISPPAKSSNVKTIPRRRVRKPRRTRQRSLTGGVPEDGVDGSSLFGDAGGVGPFGGDGGGRGWNSDGFGWSNWDESSSNSPADPAFDFVYEVISWIAFSNCLHFAFKKVVRFVADGISVPEREKVT